MSMFGQLPKPPGLDMLFAPNDKPSSGSKHLTSAERHQSMSAGKKRASSDGKITPQEQGLLGTARGNLGNLGNELQDLKSQDKRMDEEDEDSKWNPFAGLF